MIPQHRASCNAKTIKRHQGTGFSVIVVDSRYENWPTFDLLLSVVDNYDKMEADKQKITLLVIMEMLSQRIDMKYYDRNIW
jgi:hypothetical protein